MKSIVSVSPWTSSSVSRDYSESVPTPWKNSVTSRLRAGTMPTSTALISQTLRAGNGRNRYSDLVVELGRAELRPKFHGPPRAQPISKVPMNVLVLNSGSSTLKFQLIATDLGRIAQNSDEHLCRGQIERIGGEAIIAVQTRNGLRQKFTASLSDILGSLE